MLRIAPFTILLVLFAFTFPLQAIDAPSVASITDEKSECTPPKGAAALALPDADLDTRLTVLYGHFEGLPGFIDVHYMPMGEAPFVALFAERIPAAAHAVTPPTPVVLQTLPSSAASPSTADDDANGIGPGDITCQGIRPGARITVGNSICTLSFIYTDGSRIYATTAGHCITIGQTARISGVGAIGTTVYSTGSGGVGNDFAIIEVPSSLHHHVDPAMCQYGGPERDNTASILGKAILHTGHGLGLVEAPPRAKAGAGFGWGTKSFSWIGAAVPGDSGSAVQTGTGEALGVTTHIGAAFIDGNNFGSRADRALSDAGYGHLTLMTAPMNTSP